MRKRRRFKQTTSLGERLLNHAERLRKEAQSAPQALERERLTRLARQADAAAEMADFLRLEAPIMNLKDENQLRAEAEKAFRRARRIPCGREGVFARSGACST